MSISALEIFYFALSVAALVSAGFLAKLLYEAGHFLRNANRILDLFTDQLERLVGAVDGMRKRLDGLSGSLGVAGRFAADLAQNYLAKKVQNVRTSSRDKKSKDKKRGKDSGGKFEDDL